MKALIKRIPEQMEVFLIIPLTLGYFIFSSFWWLGSLNQTYEYKFGNNDALFLIVYESIVLICLYWVLKIRGWKKDELKIEISWVLTGAGVLLLAITFMAFYMAYALGQVFSNDINIFNKIQFSSDVAFPLALVMIVINSLFEELIVAGYLVTVLSKKHDVVFVIGVSLLVRLLYHTYQGPIIAVSILPMGILFALVYWKWRKLWPLIIAHSIWNLTVFA